MTSQGKIHQSNLMNKSRATLMKENYIAYKKNVIMLLENENFHVREPVY